MAAGMDQGLHDFGGCIVREIDALGRQCDATHNQPRLSTHDAWGKVGIHMESYMSSCSLQRINHLWTCDAWRTQKSIASQEGLVAIGYDRHRYGHFA